MPSRKKAGPPYVPPEPPPFDLRDARNGFVRLKSGQYVQLRVGPSLSQAEAAEQAGVTQATISKIETGSISPSNGLLQKLAWVYSIPYTQLLAASDRTRANLAPRPRGRQAR